MITASYQTRGCSDDKYYMETDANCFGLTKWEQSKSGKLMLVIGVCLLVVELLVGYGEII